MRIDGAVDARQERVERLGCIADEIDGEEMIEEDVGDDAGVVAMFRDEHAPESSNRRMRISECVDTPVLADSLGDVRRNIVSDSPFDEVAGQIADQRLGGGPGQEE